MTTAYDDDLEPDDGQDAGQPVEKDRSEFRRNQRDLENRARERDEALTRATSAERELAFYKAGVDLTNPAAKYFVKGYDGEMDVEKVKTAAEEAGLLVSAPGGEPNPEQPEASPYQRYQNPAALADAAAFQQLQSATGTPEAGDTAHRSGMEKAAQEAVKAGTSPARAIMEYMQSHGLPTIEDD